MTLDHEDVAAIADTVERGVTRSLNKFQEKLFRIMLWGGGTFLVLWLLGKFLGLLVSLLQR